MFAEAEKAFQHAGFLCRPVDSLQVDLMLAQRRRSRQMKSRADVVLVSLTSASMG
jgi:hypothetical protein